MQHSSDEAEVLVLVADRLFDTATGRCVPDLAVVCTGARIDDVVPAGRAPADGEVVRAGRVRRVELPGHTLLPGLVD